jgi:hypothetical protein
MPQSKPSRVQRRLINITADVKSGLGDIDLCAFELPRGRGCPDESGWVASLKSAEDPMNSVIVNGWLDGDLHAPS